MHYYIYDEENASSPKHTFSIRMKSECDYGLQIGGFWNDKCLSSVYRL